MSSRSVVIKGDNTNDGSKSAVVVEKFLDLLGTTDMEQIAVSRGLYFGCGHFDQNVVSGGTVDVLHRNGSASEILTGALGGFISAGAASLLEVFQAPTFTSEGTVLPVLQVNQLSSITPFHTAFHTPTLTADGTLIFRLFVPGGSTGNSVGGQGSPFQRLLSLPGVDYLIRGTNLGATTVPIGVNINTIEIPVPS